MAEDAAGAVRRTRRPSPKPRGEDRQTPETAAQGAPGAMNTATPVSQDPGTATGALSPELAAALVERYGPEIEAIGEVGERGLAELRAKLAEDPDSVLSPDVDRTVAEYAALPECLACDGSGKDDHATPFEQQLAVHFAGPPIEIDGRRRQLCMWCGHVLRDIRLADGPIAPWIDVWPTGELVRLEDGVGTVVPYLPCDTLPDGCCALPDDEPADEFADLCGKHVEGTSSNRCLLRTGHTGDHSDEFEPPELENDAERLADEEHALAAEDATYPDPEDDPDWPAEPNDGDRCGAGCGNGPEDSCWHSEED